MKSGMGTRVVVQLIALEPGLCTPREAKAAVLTSCSGVPSSFPLLALPRPYPHLVATAGFRGS